VVLRGGRDAIRDLGVALPALVQAHLAADWQSLKKKRPS